MISVRIAKSLLCAALCAILLTTARAVFAAPPVPGAVPEPGTWAILGSFAVTAGGFVLLRNRKRK